MSSSTEPGRRAEKLRQRAAGMLLHVTSLSGGAGVGDLGPEAFKTADFLAKAGLRWWQMLPICPVGAGDSPYSSPSTFAGEPLLVALEPLVDMGLLESGDLAGAPPEGSRADYGAARAFKEPRLRKAAAKAAKDLDSPAWRGFQQFYAKHADWLDDHARFFALKERFPGKSWTEWPDDVRARRFKKWDRELLKFVGEASFYHQFVQYLFQEQWTRLREYCDRRGIHLMGDVPIFVAHESADVWAHQELFQLGPDGKPVVVAGVPPDYFSATGQRWGNPHYRWDALKSRGYDWWIGRLKAASERFDAVRLDHFIGFENYWEIPADRPTAVEGRWVPGPSASFFEAVGRALPQLELVAEDLGSITPAVAALRDKFNFPGMRVLQFAFGADTQAESFLPHNYPRRTVAYTGTHDNDTTMGWYQDPGGRGGRSPEQAEKERHHARVYLKSDGHSIHWDMIEALMRSTADVAMFPAQDFLGLPGTARMNTPGTAEGNWRWRLLTGDLSNELATRLRDLASRTGRLSDASGGR